MLLAAVHAPERHAMPARLPFPPSGLAREKRSLRRRHHRRRSADYAHDVRSAASLAASEGATSDGGASSMRDALTPFASRGSFDMLLQVLTVG